MNNRTYANLVLDILPSVHLHADQIIELKYIYVLIRKIKFFNKKINSGKEILMIVRQQNKDTD